MTIEMSPDARAVMESLEFDPSAEPYYEHLKACRAWPDEGMFAPIGGADREVLGNLLVARSFIHAAAPVEHWAHPPDHAEYLLELWNAAMAEFPNWPGFRRIVLRQRDRDFLDRARAQAANLS